MTEAIINQTFGHMRWANQKILNLLSQLSDEALQLHANHDDWTVARIAHHLVGVSDRLIARATGQAMPTELEIPSTASDMITHAKNCDASDARLHDLALQPDAMCTFDLFGKTQTQLRSVILAQAVHHADEHRAQIAGILASHSITLVNLDELSLWHFNKVL